jgi:single-stranded DNA-specific DHH superfamily exonuclease
MSEVYRCEACRSLSDEHGTNVVTVDIGDWSIDHLCEDCLGKMREVVL